MSARTAERVFAHLVDADQGQVLVPQPGIDSPVAPWIALEALHRNPTAVREVGPLQRGLVVDFRGLDAAGDEQVPAIGADDEPLLLRNSGTCLGVAANAGDPVAVPNERLHREASLAARHNRHGGVDEDLIEYNTPRAVCLGNGSVAAGGAPVRVKAPAGSVRPGPCPIAPALELGHPACHTMIGSMTSITPRSSSQVIERRCCSGRPSSSHPVPLAVSPATAGAAGCCAGDAPLRPMSGDWPRAASRRHVLHLVDLAPPEQVI